MVPHPYTQQSCPTAGSDVGSGTSATAELSVADPCIIKITKTWFDQTANDEELTFINFRIFFIYEKTKKYNKANNLNFQF